MLTKARTITKAIVAAVIACLGVLAGATEHNQHLTQNSGILAALAFFVAFNGVYFATNTTPLSVDPQMAALIHQVNILADQVNKLGGGK